MTSTLADKDNITPDKASAEAVLDTLGRDIGMWLWDIRADRLTWSPRLYELLGYLPQHYAPKPTGVYDSVHPEDVPLLQAAMRAHLKEGVPYRRVFRVMHADGHYIHCRTEASTARAADGTPVKVTGFTCEVSAEMAAHQALKESEQRLSVLAANFDGAIFRYRRNLDGTDQVDYMSAGAERVWGLDPNEIIGNPSRIWGSVHSEDVAGVEAVFTLGTRDLTRINHRWRVVLPDGAIRWVECRATPRRLASGDTVWDGFVIDISKAMAAREELRATSEMLGQAQKMEAIGRIAGGIAHDFNNLLAIVLGNAELLDTRSMEREDLESIDAIVNACQKGADLTARLLSFARQSRLDPQRVNLQEVVDEIIPLLQRTLPEDIVIRWEPDAPQESWVEVDVGLLESSILNIMLNARDSMPNGGEIMVRIANRDFETDYLTRNGAVVPAGEYVALEIIDTGHGIPPDLLDRVTEPFVTSKGPEMGSGLGLAMVDGFIAQSGGALEIESREGTGTQITLCIPKALPCLENETSTAPPVSAAPRLRGRVLLVEDDVEVRLVIARVLRRFGLEVEAVPDGTRALAVLVKSNPPIDLLVSDVVIPGQPSGIDLARLARAQNPDLPVILISGYSDEAFREEQQRGDLGIFLRKPVSREQLARVISDVLPQDSYENI